MGTVCPDLEDGGADASPAWRAPVREDQGARQQEHDDAPGGGAQPRSDPSPRVRADASPIGVARPGNGAGGRHRRVELDATAAAPEAGTRAEHTGNPERASVDTLDIADGSDRADGLDVANGPDIADAPGYANCVDIVTQLGTADGLDSSDRRYLVDHHDIGGASHHVACRTCGARNARDR